VVGEMEGMEKPEKAYSFTALINLKYFEIIS
jgi:hypothetical protein